MASVLDLSLIQYFDSFYALVFVFGVTYALLTKTQAISDSTGINGIVSIMVSLLVILSEPAIKTINFMIPWFVVMIIFGILLLLFAMVFGLKNEDLGGIIQDKGVYWPIIGISLIIFLAALGNTFGQDFLEQGQDQPADDFTQNITEIFFNPKVIAIISIFTLSIFMVILLTV